MTVINQNSISGITSITAASGSVQIFNSDGSTGSLTNLAGVNVVGVVTATSYVVSAGTTSAPSISPSGDSNTGIFFPSADTIAFGEGGAEVGRFDSSGRLGIGTASPSAKLEVSGGDINISTNGQFLRGKDGAGDHKILLGYSAAQTVRLSEFCYLDVSNSRFGIGTTSPVSALNVSVADGGNVTISNTNDGHTGALAFGDTSSNTSGRVSYDHFNDSMRFDTAGTERVRLDSSGRLLVGTSSQLGNGIIQAKANSDSSTGEGILLLAKGDGATAGQNLGQIKFTNSTGNQAAWITALADTGWGGSGSGDYPGALTFATTADGTSSPTEAMRITSDGRVLFDTTGTPSASVTGAAFTPQTNGRMSLFSSTSSTASQKHVLFFNPNGEVGSISTNASATAYTTSSDYRLKENIIPLTGASERVLQLKPSRFNFIADPDIQVDGFIAHEAQAVVPECVTGEKDAVDDKGNPIYQGIDQSKLVPLLTAALQEAIAKIETLEAKVAALEAS
jgi:hypothetical protein